jgi:hypothetical protein
VLYDPHSHLVMLPSFTEVARAREGHAKEDLLAWLVGFNFADFDGVWGNLSGGGWCGTFRGDFGGELPGCHLDLSC